MTREIKLTMSESWMRNDFDEIHSILEDTIKEFIPNNERIINIEVKEQSGFKRFWIYSEIIKND